MAREELAEFNLPKDAYASFDAVSLKRHIIDRLNTSSEFTDQNFEGSNLSSLTDIVAFMYHTLLFYLNTTSSEAFFTQAQIYENMNKLVSLIGYNPVGPQTSILSFLVDALESLSVGTYTIKRYSFITAGNTAYSFTKDVTFEKLLTGRETLETFAANNLLYEGRYKEYPKYTAIGEDFETITITIENLIDPETTKFIDHNNIDVYVKDAASGDWALWNEVTSLYLEGATSKAFERRLNSSGRYEIKFGNDINGKGLNATDTVAIFYLESTGEKGSVGVSVIDNGVLAFYNSSTFREIAGDVYDDTVTFLGVNDVDRLKFSNTSPSTKPTSFESVDEIRENAPKLFTAQNRAVTTGDYDAIIKKNFRSIISASSVVSNSEYTSEYMKYLYDIGLERPNEDSRVLTNQVGFADACDFNNIYIFMVPALGAILNETEPNYLSNASKQLILNEFEAFKMASHEVVPSDPVYIAFDMGISQQGETLIPALSDETTLIVKRKSTSRLSSEQLTDLVYNTIVSFFSQDSNTIGQLVNLTTLNNSILSIEGVDTVETHRTTSDGTLITSPGIGMVLWNPIYPTQDINTTFQPIQLPVFKYPFLYNKSAFRNKIKVDV
tara:strand:- start:28562 stop:30391 length:1830 start_codon:yes stop_codon:yes gene_type:complete